MLFFSLDWSANASAQGGGRTTVASAHLFPLIQREEIAEGAMAFNFGQSLDLTLMDPPEPDAEGNEQKIEILTGKHRAGRYH
jgi:hypothetical protein